ncbi:MAG: dihydroorotate dehydrogenase electron transfer subunit [Thermoproteota archaeon]|nr:dihydroorotate dehydrogenase electron transfer subunit [Candidatus Brockarchaeota archaeon]MBO3768392.1 dihydroorotate dehydrogenase electron transfer subunit [Candidatus Brockarchaeota archaeon]MBO3801833.1 dihydroorotate dehydrogenase electron transfer subunit [Candidatus Brockarchaeota archaeon]
MSYYIRGKLELKSKPLDKVAILNFNLDEDINCKPGQYIMAWIPNYGEIPLSPSFCSDKKLQLLVEDVGTTSNKFVNLELGSYAYFRGPFGNFFNLSKGNKYLLVAGGTGAAPILMAAKNLSELNVEAIVIYGGRSKNHLVFLEEFNKYLRKVYAYTEDGTFGYYGVVTKDLQSIIDSFSPDVILTTGPEMMMRKVIEISVKNKIYCEASIVRIIKCASGVCGSCVLEPLGLLTCKDGPVFNGNVLINSNFGKTMRSESGREVEIK